MKTLIIKFAIHLSFLVVITTGIIIQLGENIFKGFALQGTQFSNFLIDNNLIYKNVYFKIVHPNIFKTHFFDKTSIVVWSENIVWALQ